MLGDDNAAMDLLLGMPVLVNERHTLAAYAVF